MYLIFFTRQSAMLPRTTPTQELKRKCFDFALGFCRSFSHTTHNWHIPFPYILDNGEFTVVSKTYGLLELSYSVKHLVSLISHTLNKHATYWWNFTVSCGNNRCLIQTCHIIQIITFLLHTGKTCYNKNMK